MRGKHKVTHMLMTGKDGLEDICSMLISSFKRVVQ
jgi:hypothetical protein